MKTDLVEIYRLLSSLNVSGDAVDIMATVRLKIRKLIKSLDAKAGTEVRKDGE